MLNRIAKQKNCRSIDLKEKLFRKAAITNSSYYLFKSNLFKTLASH